MPKSTVTHAGISRVPTVSGVWISQIHLFERPEVRIIHRIAPEYVNPYQLIQNGTYVQGVDTTQGSTVIPKDELSDDTSPSAFRAHPH
jgi:hypothetical protein